MRLNTGRWNTTKPFDQLMVDRGIDPRLPRLQLLMDTGNFLEDPYDKLALIAPKTAYVQPKTCFGGGIWYTLDLDYGRIAEILRKAGYHGYIELEFEGKED